MNPVLTQPSPAYVTNIGKMGAILLFIRLQLRLKQVPILPMLLIYNDLTVEHGWK